MSEPFLRPAPSLKVAAPRFRSIGAFCDEFEPIDFVVDGIVRTGSLYTLTAKTGVGKTGFLVEAALAVGTGRPDILGREVERGRVAYVACENPDDLRMRLMVAAHVAGIDIGEMADQIIVLDQKAPPEAIVRHLSAETGEAFGLIIVDTLAAFFDGQDINDNVQGGNFARRLRPLTQIVGRPAVIVAAHPAKSADETNLVPYGAGAILNEVDGNLTLAKTAGGVNLHWAGKLRGLDFDPVGFRFMGASCSSVVDRKQRQITMPVLIPASPEAMEARSTSDVNNKIALLRAMIDAPAGTQADWAARVGISQSGIAKCLVGLRQEKLVDNVLRRWVVTPKGRKAAEAVEL